MLKTINLSHSYDYPLFNNVNININERESIAIIGRSGSGKSTLLNSLSSLLKPTSGEIIFENKNLYSLKEKELLKIRREIFGIIFQAHYLFRGFSGIENLEVSSLLSKNKINDNILKKLKIQDVVKQQIGTLSGGQQQRVSIARVLTKNPKIIFADEPTGNLDKETSHDVMNIIFNYIKTNNSSLFLVTHDEKLANRCDKVYKLENQELLKL